MTRCHCHRDHMYDALTECPECHHWSFESLPTWGGCERRACGYERHGPPPPPPEEQLEMSMGEPDA